MSRSWAVMLNRARVVQRLKKLPEKVRRELQAQLEVEARELAETIRRNVPERTGLLKSTVRVEPNPERELSLLVRAGGTATTKKIGTRTYEREVRIGSGDTQGIARKQNGKGVIYDYALAVEFGTTETEAKPFFYPTYRIRKRKMRRGMRSAARKAAKAAMET